MLWIQETKWIKNNDKNLIQQTQHSIQNWHTFHKLFISFFIWILTHSLWLLVNIIFFFILGNFYSIKEHSFIKIYTWKKNTYHTVNWSELMNAVVECFFVDFDSNFSTKTKKNSLFSYFNECYDLFEYLISAQKLNSQPNIDRFICCLFGRCSFIYLDVFQFIQFFLLFTSMILEAEEQNK